MDGTHYIEATEMLIGSRPDCDLVFRNAGLSGRHARLSREADQFFLEDLRSTEGTCVNGEALLPYRKRRLDKQDVILAGRLSLRLHAETPVPARRQIGAEPVSRRSELAHMGLKEKMDHFRQRLQQHIGLRMADNAATKAMTAHIETDLTLLQEFVTARFSEHEMLQELTRKLAGVLEIPELLAVALTMIREVLHADRGFVILYHSKHGVPISLVALGFDGKPPEHEADLSRALARRSHQNREAIFVTDAAREHPLGSTMPADAPASLVAIPLEQGDHILGVLYLDTWEPGRFHVNQTGFLEACASQIALSLENVRLYTQSVTDSLTRLYNRKYMDERIAEEMVRAHRYRRHCSLLLFDIDYFKQVNDTHGHGIGDKVLRNTANQLRAAARSTDIVARYGGEEFLLLLTETKLPGALSFAERLRAAIEATVFEVGEHQIKITISCGVAAYQPVFGNKVTDFFKKADEALYRAKQAGRNRVYHAPED